MRRLIRVHLGSEPTFVIESYDGVVQRCSRGFEARVVSEHPHGWVGLSERDVAVKLRARGALFVDLLEERTVVRVRRGYAPRDTSVRVSGEPVRSAKGVRNARHEAKADKPLPPPAKRNLTMESLRSVVKPTVDVELPERDVPF